MIDDAAPFPGLTGLGARDLREGPWRIVVAGAGGWMGLASIEQLHGLLGPEFFRRVACFGSNARALSLRGGLTVHQEPLSALRDLRPAPTLVLYFAFLTQEKAGLLSRDAYIEANQAISDQVFRSLGPMGAEAVFVASSGAVELVNVPGADPNKAIYGALKLADERRFSAWAVDNDKRAVVARIFGLSGPYINKIDSYALSCFIRDVLMDRPIVVKASRPVFRSYVAVDELMSIALALMIQGDRGATLFDTGAARGYEMGEIAAGVDRALGGLRGISRPALVSQDPDWYVGDGTVYSALRGRYDVRVVDFATQVRETARYMRAFSGAPGW